MKIIRQCVGIDCSKDTLDVAISFLDETFHQQVFSTQVFENNEKGFKRLTKWIKKNCHQDLLYQTVVEATGVYHERLAYALTEQGFPIAVVLPNKIRNYCRSTDVRTITDKISAMQIAEFGLVKKLNNWTPPDKVYAQLKGLCRERVQLLATKNSTGNQLHAYRHAATDSHGTAKRAAHRIKLIDAQIQQIENEIEKVVNEHSLLKEKIKKICTVKGLGLVTVATVIAETNGFNLIRNCRQLACYAGYDVVQKQSGISVNKKPHISHKGNKYIRRALYLPAFTAVKHDERMEKLYNRLFDRQKIKMKSYVAVQRKLLLLIYTLWKKNEVYNHLQQLHSINNLEQQKNAALTELVYDRSMDYAHMQI